MRKVLLIIKREYLSRVRKKSFLVMTFLVPALIIGMYALIIALSIRGGDKQTSIRVLDESGIFAGKFKNTKSVEFQTAALPLAQEKQLAAKENGGFLLIIPKNIEQGGNIELYSRKKAGMLTISAIEDQMNDILRTKQLKDAGIDPEMLNQINPNLSIESKELTAEGEKDSSAGAAYGVSFAAAILIYLALFIYGAQVMRGVIEEKTSRIIEVVISSVKPFQLMMGKIIGIGLVGLTQFMLWIVLSTTLSTITSQTMTVAAPEQVQLTQQDKKSARVAIPPAGESPVATIFKAMDTIDFKYILTMFLVYFLGGFMLYSALFAAVGSAVDSETETQQFMLPITLPLLFTYIMAFSFIVNNPDSTLSFWLSIIPFTSPVAMMVRLPFGVPAWQLTLSIGLLVAGFVFTTWVASRIYRVGILMYGKRSSYKELVKWFMYRE
ncbi:ABC transporter permease [Pedobacter sp. BS3]|uniref:ABC transporter permease n=1 Tax=Pedobacter sp. BS3 TaxID=2567937 RepID=UPI0011EEB0C1|nr:ABC transporter permease [Pedobacter sp. BS3]TZF82667.1 ABC transporter permease [Pedobacter sp. BS3]